VHDDSLSEKNEETAPPEPTQKSLPGKKRPFSEIDSSDISQKSASKIPKIEVDIARQKQQEKVDIIGPRRGAPEASPRVAEEEDHPPQH
jgi:hypothetical protein